MENWRDIKDLFNTSTLNSIEVDGVQETKQPFSKYLNK